jgi:hypothetical protein
MSKILSESEQAKMLREHNEKQRAAVNNTAVPTEPEQPPVSADDGTTVSGGDSTPPKPKATKGKPGRADGGSKSKANLTDKIKYYWLKLFNNPVNFFDTKFMRLLTRYEYGTDEYRYSHHAGQIAYIKMLVEATPTNGVLAYDGFDTFEALIGEIAHTIREDICIVLPVVELLMRHGGVEVLEDGSVFLPECIELTGKEGTDAERKREERKAAVRDGAKEKKV